MADYILSITIDPPGAGGVQPTPRGDYVSPGKVSYPAGTAVSLKALVYLQGAWFDHWEGDLTGEENPKTIVMNSNKSVRVVYGVEPTYPTFELTTSVVGKGSVAPSSGIYNEGDQIIVVAYPGYEYEFSKWSGDTGGTWGVPGMPNHLNVPMDRDRHLIAEFTAVSAPPVGEAEFRSLSCSYNKL